MSKQNNKITKKYSQFVPSRIQFTDLEENSRSKGQKISYVRYNDEKKGEQTLLLQSPHIELNTYGIPKKGDYYPDEKQRAFLKCPLDLDGDETKTFYEKLVELDKLLDSDEMRGQIFGSVKKSKGYKYQPIVRQSAQQTIDENSDSDGEGEGDKSAQTKTSYPRPPYFKAKFNLDYETGNIKTKMYKSENGTRTKFNVTDLESVETLVTYRSKVRMVVMPNKLWALKTFDGKKYGLSFKIMHMEVEPVQRSTLKEYFENDAFIDSEDDEDEDDDVQESKEAPALKTSALDDGDDEDESLLGDDSDKDDDDDDSDSDSESEVQAKPPPKKKGGRKKSSKNASSSA